jgi:hypothetical protein
MLLCQSAQDYILPERGQIDKIGHLSVKAGSEGCQIPDRLWRPSASCSAKTEGSVVGRWHAKRTHT